MGGSGATKVSDNKDLENSIKYLESRTKNLEERTTKQWLEIDVKFDRIGAKLAGISDKLDKYLQAADLKATNPISDGVDEDISSKLNQVNDLVSDSVYQPSSYHVVSEAELTKPISICAAKIKSASATVEEENDDSIEASSLQIDGDDRTDQVEIGMVIGGDYFQLGDNRSLFDRGKDETINSNSFEQLIVMSFSSLGYLMDFHFTPWTIILCANDVEICIEPKLFVQMSSRNTVLLHDLCEKKILSDALCCASTHVYIHIFPGGISFSGCWSVIDRVFDRGKDFEIIMGVYNEKLVYVLVSKHEYTSDEYSSLLSDLMTAIWSYVHQQMWSDSWSNTLALVKHAHWIILGLTSFFSFKTTLLFFGILYHIHWESFAGIQEFISVVVFSIPGDFIEPQFLDLLHCELQFYKDQGKLVGNSNTSVCEFVLHYEYQFGLFCAYLDVFLFVAAGENPDGSNWNVQRAQEGIDILQVRLFTEMSDQRSWSGCADAEIFCLPLVIRCFGLAQKDSFLHCQVPNLRREFRVIANILSFITVRRLGGYETKLLRASEVSAPIIPALTCKLSIHYSNTAKTASIAGLCLSTSLANNSLSPRISTCILSLSPGAVFQLDIYEGTREYLVMHMGSQITIMLLRMNFLKWKFKGCSTRYWIMLLGVGTVWFSMEIQWVFSFSWESIWYSWIFVCLHAFLDFHLYWYKGNGSGDVWLFIVLLGCVWLLFDRGRLQETKNWKLAAECDVQLHCLHLHLHVQGGNTKGSPPSLLPIVWSAQAMTEFNSVAPNDAAQLGFLRVQIPSQVIFWRTNKISSCYQIPAGTFEVPEPVFMPMEFWKVVHVGWFLRLLWVLLPYYSQVWSWLAEAQDILLVLCRRSQIMHIPIWMNLLQWCLSNFWNMRKYVGAVWFSIKFPSPDFWSSTVTHVQVFSKFRGFLRWKFRLCSPVLGGAESTRWIPKVLQLLVASSDRGSEVQHRQVMIYGHLGFKLRQLLLFSWGNYITGCDPQHGNGSLIFYGYTLVRNVVHCGLLGYLSVAYFSTMLVYFLQLVSTTHIFQGLGSRMTDLLVASGVIPTCRKRLTLQVHHQLLVGPHLESCKDLTGVFIGVWTNEFLKCTDRRRDFYILRLQHELVLIYLVPYLATILEDKDHFKGEGMSCT